MKILILIALAFFTGCATTTHPPMKGVFTPHFKSDLQNLVKVMP